MQLVGCDSAPVRAALDRSQYAGRATRRARSTEASATDRPRSVSVSDHQRSPVRPRSVDAPAPAASHTARTSISAWLSCSVAAATTSRPAPGGVRPLAPGAAPTRRGTGRRPRARPRRRGRAATARPRRSGARCRAAARARSAGRTAPPIELDLDAVGAVAGSTVGAWHPGMPVASQAARFIRTPLTRSREARKDAHDPARRSSSTRTTSGARSCASRTRSSRRTADGDVALVGIHRRGAHLATRLHRLVSDLLDAEVPLGDIDIAFYRDDLATRGADASPVVHASHLPLPARGPHGRARRRRALHRPHRARRRSRRCSTTAAPRACSSPCSPTAATASCRSAPTTSARTCPTARAERVNVRVEEIDGARRGHDHDRSRRSPA